MRWLAAIVLSIACWVTLSIVPVIGQGNQCRTSPVGASTYYCASEAFVTNSSGFSGQPASETGNISITATNNRCGALILASGGQNTVTLASPSGFPSRCIVTIKDDEVYSGSGTGRGKLLSGFPADIFSTLYPGQTLMVAINAAGSAWTTIINPGRWKIPTSAELCVRQDGNDSHDGLGTGAAADCLALVQQAVLNIGQQWDGGGYNACNIGIYAGGTSIINESVSQTGQSIGCFLTVNVRGAFTWTGTGACYTSGDNSITIVNWNLGFVPTFSCNSANTASTGQFKCHQTCIYDFNGGTAIWLPGGNPGVNTGSNDVFFDVDLQGSATFNATVNIGDGVNTFLPATFIQCEAHCSKITASGSVAFSAHVTMGVAFVLKSGSVITTGLSWPGATITNPTVPSAGSNLITNGTTIPGGTNPAVPGAGCALNAVSPFGLVCLTAL